jgi:hypothetical protein
MMPAVDGTLVTVYDGSAPVAAGSTNGCINDFVTAEVGASRQPGGRW